MITCLCLSGGEGGTAVSEPGRVTLVTTSKHAAQHPGWKDGCRECPARELLS